MLETQLPLRRLARWAWVAAVLTAGATPAGRQCAAAPGEAPAAIVCPAGASRLETLAAREVQRYAYLRTGRLLPIAAALPARGDALVVAPWGRLPAAVRPAGGAPAAQQYRLRTLRRGDRRILCIAGGDDVGTLYGAYRYAWHLGVRFGLHGDTVPDRRIPFTLPDLDDTGKPLFALRGIQPFHDFAEGPDWWNRDDYLAVLAQLPKLRMNFIGLHTYPEGAGPEPAVWIGRREDVRPDGSVAFAYPSSWMNTLRGGWGSAPKKTGEYAFGADQLFERDDYGPEVMAGHCPAPATPEGSREVFARAGTLLHDAFTFARALGVKTCVGTETPLMVPRPLAQRVAAAADRPAPWARAQGGNLAHYPNPIRGTSEETVYQTVRWGLDGYRLSVPDGIYKVTLRFSELAYGEPGKRVFGVKIQDRPAIERLDIFAEVGKNAPLDRVFPGVVVAGGQLAIEFVRIVEHPCIAAIVVEGERFTGRVNCGGPAYREYAADDGVASLTAKDIQALYEGTFLRIARTHPLDYYWLWTPEGWTWDGASEAQVQATLEDLRLAMAAAEKVGAPFRLATCGWVLGPPKDRAMFDARLPREMPFSCINRQVGNAPVEPGFARVKGRDKWAIPWLEDDPTLTSPQLWAGRMRKDAVDARKYGCTGLMGIHWRTRVLSPNVAALADAAWEQQGWEQPPAAPESPRAEGPIGGRHAGFPDNRIEGTEAAALYQTVRYGMAAYHLPLPNGEYAVTLRFCEPHYKEPGQRVFGVKLQGRQVIEHLDVLARAGRNRALDYSFPGIRVADGWLSITFTPEVEYPCIAALAVQGAGAVRKVNCGGPAHADYAADWPPGEIAPAQDRSLPAGDFYRDWARAEFGPEVAEDAGRLFARVDGRLPRPTTWVNGPGGIAPDGRPWEETLKGYAFLGEMEALRPRVAGAGHRARFDYWLAQFRGMLATERVKHVWARCSAAMKEVGAQPDPAVRRDLAERRVLPLRRELIAAVGDVYRDLLATVSTPGEMGTVDNWERHILPEVLTKPGGELAKLLGRDLPADAQPSRAYAGPLRVIVPTVRGSVDAGEALRLKVILPAQSEVADAALFWRPLGRGAFTRVALRHLARGVYGATLPPAAGTALEYYIQASTRAGERACFPPTAPALCQTVVVMPRGE